MFYVDSDQKANFLLSYDFPLVMHETYLKNKPRGFNDWHWHEEIQFSYVLEGSMIMTSEGHDHYLSAGSGIFINSHCAHMSRPVGPESARFLTLNVQPSLLTLFHGSVVEQKYYLPYVDDPNMQVISFSPESPLESRILQKLRSMMELLQEREFGFELEVYGKLLHLWDLILIYSEMHIAPAARMERREAHEMLNYIHENYNRNITLDEMAEHVHLSKGECCRMFRSTYGCSIFTHVMNYRINQSIPLLTGSEMSMTQIAEACGFNSPSYFTKVFREKVGETPLQYRRNCNDRKNSGI